MALLHLLPPPLSLTSPPPPSPPRRRALSLTISANLYLRLQQNNPLFNQRFSNGISIPTWFSPGDERSVAVRASSEADLVNEIEPESEKSEEAVSVENLPLESKQQMILEQRLKMKLAKKLRLRRKRLVRKRRLRKKGRWPPSKMKKLKNV